MISAERRLPFEQLVIDQPGRIVWEFLEPGGTPMQIEFSLRYDGELIGFVSSHGEATRADAHTTALRGQLIVKLREIAVGRIQRPRRR